MSAKHTPGRVKAQHPHAGDRGWEVAFEPGLEQLCQDITEANARRLMACWNACEGLSTESARLHLLPYAAAELRRLHAENESLVADAERYRWLKEHPNEWRIYRKHGKHKLPFRMMRDGDPWGQSFATADEAVDAARSKT